jgi:hypothetical protein
MSLANAILQEDETSFRQLILHDDINQIDEYGFTPLIEAAIVDNLYFSDLLLRAGAQPNLQDVVGNTALHWAAENNNHKLSELLLQYHADPNAYNLAGQAVLVMPTLRRQTALRQILIQAGADENFAQDFINTKLLGHMYELVGTANIVAPNNDLVEVDFEGFYLEVTLGLIANSLQQFYNHFAARHLRRYAGIAHFIVQMIQRAWQLIQYQQYRVEVQRYEKTIDEIILQEPLLIPVGYEGHAITFIKYDDMWVKCDRREDSRLYDNVMIYQIGNSQVDIKALVKHLIYQKQTSDFINQELDQILQLQAVTEIKVSAQISGNCSWANVEAAIPALFFLVLRQFNHDSQAHGYYKTLALNFYQRWREWNKDRALNFCIQSYRQGDSLRKASKAEILAAILFEACDIKNVADRDRIENIVAILRNSPYEYILKNYLRVYYYEGHTEEGKRFAELLKEYGFQV